MNFITMLLTVVLGIIKFWTPELDLDADNVIRTFAEGNISTMLMFAVNAFTPIQKIVKNQLWKNLGFVKSRNFLTQATSLVMVVLSELFKADIPLDGAGEVADAVATGDIGLIMGAVGVHIINAIVQNVTPKE